MRIAISTAAAELGQYLETEVVNAGHLAIHFPDLRQAVGSGVDLVFAEWASGAALSALLDGLALARKSVPPLPVVVLVPVGAVGLIRRARAVGAVDALFTPPDPGEILAEIQHAAGPLAFRDDVEREIFDKITRESLIGTSEAFRRCLEEVRHAARSNVNVLLLGETGTGKERFARAVHDLSDRAGKPFRAVVCAAKPMDLIESELFGSAKGAYTGADRDREGDLAAAGGGTILLDEIGDIQPVVQVKLLRVIEEREFQRLGDKRVYEFQARLICATLVDLEEAVRDKSFRRDLLGRIDQFRIAVPPLRERASDIPLLARHFLFKHSGQRVVGISPTAMRILQEFDFPENVRQLDNAIQEALGRSLPGDEILPQHLPERITAPRRRLRAISVPYDLPYEVARDAAQSEIDLAYLKPALERLKSMSRVAEEFGINRDTVASRLARAERPQEPPIDEH